MAYGMPHTHTGTHPPTCTSTNVVPRLAGRCGRRRCRPSALVNVSLVRAESPRPAHTHRTSTQLQEDRPANTQVDQAVDKLEAQGRRVTHFSVVSS